MLSGLADPRLFFVWDGSHLPGKLSGRTFPSLFYRSSFFFGFYFALDFDVELLFPGLGIICVAAGKVICGPDTKVITFGVFDALSSS